ncbi:hypothetical protein [Spirulina sp. 06S082]|uniref:hypothetical protein n=1 Tax=Spirulina sp. 06S082 TaxID=3110248 RepID=UPI002B1F8751|nr:hypothetical protein [Spirulina sp. 06S082]
MFSIPWRIKNAIARHFILSNPDWDYSSPPPSLSSPIGRQARSRFREESSFSH